MKKARTYSKIKYLAKISAPVFSALFYVFIVAAALMLVLAFVMLFVNVAPEKLLLPPFIHIVEKDGVTDGYNLYVGNGIRIYAQYAAVTLDKMKAVLYAGIFIVAAFFITAAPFCRFISRLFKNIGGGVVFAANNPRYICYIGLDVMLGVTVVSFIARFYNYYLASLFVADGSNMFLSLNIDFAGIAVGALILLFGCIYGYACECYRELHGENNEKAMIESKNDRK